MASQHNKTHNPTLSFIYVTVMSGGAPRDQPAAPSPRRPLVPGLFQLPTWFYFRLCSPRHVLIRPFHIFFLPLFVFVCFFLIVPATALAGVCVLRDTHTRHTHTLTTDICLNPKPPTADPRRARPRPHNTATLKPTQRPLVRLS